MNWLSNPRLVCLGILLTSLSALGIAYASQVWGGLHPCALCIYQRYAYGLAAAIGLLGLLPGLGQRFGRALVTLGGLTFFGGAGIAFFHVGVEQLWWRGLEACSTPEFDPNLSIEELREQILNSTFVPCDQIPWELFGISIAGYNVLVSLALAAVSLWAAGHTMRKQAA